MRTIPAALLCAALTLLAAPAALAHPHPDDPAPQHRVRLKPDEARLVLGTYELSNGDVLKVQRIGVQYWAETAATGRIEIVPVGAYEFVDTSGALRFTFIPYGWPDEVKISGLSP